MLAMLVFCKWTEAFEPSTWSSWVLVAITLGATIAAVIATIAAFRTLKLLGIQTGDTKRAVEAALLNAKAVVNSERAWVEISLGPPEPDPNVDPEYYDTSNQYSVRITNHGRTVAKIESFKIAGDCVSGPLNLNALNHVSQNYNTLLGVGENTVLTNIDLNSFADWKSISDRTKTGVYHFVVKYRDVVDSSAEHMTSALYVYNEIREDLERISTYNKYS